MPEETPRSRTQAINGLPIHILEWGDPKRRAALVLLHHVESNAHAWGGVAPALGNRYRVVAPDLRGHGDSGWAGEGHYTTEEYASDIVGLIESMGVGPVDLLGGSLGGRVALVTAATRPDLVKRLVMEDVGAERPRRIADRLQSRVREGKPAVATLDEAVQYFKDRYALVPEEDVRRIAVNAVKRDEVGRFVWKRDPALARDFVELSLWDYVARVKAPTLVLIGKESDIVPPEMAQRMLSIIPEGRVAVVEGAGHYIALRQPEVFLREVGAFLASHTLGGIP